MGRTGASTWLICDHQQPLKLIRMVEQQRNHSNTLFFTFTVLNKSAETVSIGGRKTTLKLWLTLNHCSVAFIIVINLIFIFKTEVDWNCGAFNLTWHTVFSPGQVEVCSWFCEPGGFYKVQERQREMRTLYRRRRLKRKLVVGWVYC